ncbi:hypothetical protein DO021_06860 [Desulfobacter hydrogenophilus]|uniref:Uncharacterized protein n=1 Tax=Desulfobacter hydrogenophilus TaxID=2291 RepID=A0A328FI17_9BACT|nr:hypothetical protein [Desulfobacter hydrogenophilus]NDY71264.1 hypothetical protein [Desulfobacter hydrogenophilus]QBH14999.1 hypothetical protein EYB58_20000 [Desulfobacter hydrogenophilus]RAM02793.1 hypothetical protein DO021_06860 [Desulfobacter hydrogenophilus]
MFKFIVKSFFLLFVLAVVACPFLFLFAVIDKTPAVGKPPELSFDQVKRMEQLVRLYKPDSMSVRQTRQVELFEQDLNLMAAYVASEFVDQVAIFPQIRLSDPFINISTAVKIPQTPLGEYINTACVLKIENGRPRVHSMSAGFFTLPGSLITAALSYLGQALLAPDEYKLVLQNLDALQSVAINRQQLSFTYDWNPDALNRLHESQKSMLIAPEHQDRLILYTNALAKMCSTFKKYDVNKVCVVRVIRPLFKLALEQSNVSKNPVEENRAVLQTISLFCLGRGLEHLVTEERAANLISPESIALTLWDREDLVKHFFVSAGIAVSGGSKLSNFAGLSKEVADSGGGSGFSFADLAADRAGVRLGELATGSAQKASEIQQKMAAAKTEGQFMPRIDNLPEGIMELQFKKRYSDFDSNAYTLVENEITQRINACLVYQ